MKKMKRKMATLAALVGLLAPASARAAVFELVSAEFHAHDKSHGGCFYGMGWRELEYEITITEGDLKSGGSNFEMILGIAQDLYGRIYKGKCGCSGEEIANQLLEQNPDYYRLKAGDILRYKTTQSVGKSGDCIF